MKKLIIFFVLLMINSIFVYGATQVKGYIYINIVNEPPEITSIFFYQDEVYEDSTIDCDALYTDEIPEIVELKYRWYVNDNLVNVQGSSLSPSYFEADDIVTCKIIPNDQAQDGEQANITIIVQNIPIGTKMAKGVLQLAGVSSSASELISIRREEGMMGVTGFVVREVGNQSKGLSIPIFILVLMVLLLVTVNLVLRSYVKKQRT